MTVSLTGCSGPHTALMGVFPRERLCLVTMLQTRGTEAEFLCELLLLVLVLLGDVGCWEAVCWELRPRGGVMDADWGETEGAAETWAEADAGLVTGASEDMTAEDGSGHATATGVEGDLGHGSWSGIPLVGGTTATFVDNSWFAETEDTFVTGRRTGDGTEPGTLAGHVVDNGVATELKAKAGEAGAATGLWGSCCFKTKAGTGIMVGRWAVRSWGWSCSMWQTMTLFIWRGDIPGAEKKTGAGTGRDASVLAGTESFPEGTSDAGTVIAVSIRCCTLEGSKTCWLSSGGGVRPISRLQVLLCDSACSVSVGLFWLFSFISFSSSIAFCAATSARRRKALKSGGAHWSGGVGGGVLKRPLVVLAAVFLLARLAK